MPGVSRAHRLCLLCSAVAFSPLGCGARSGLDLGAAEWETQGDGGAGVGDDAAGAADGAAGTTGEGGDTARGDTGGGETGDGSAVLAGDRCPAAVAGPKAMLRNCSTRDGRSRVGAPASPHVAWVGSTPSNRGGLSGQSALATDLAGHVYVATVGADAVSQTVIERLETTSGALDWKDVFSPNNGSGTPIVLATGSMDVFAYDGEDPAGDVLLAYDPSVGSSSPIPISFELHDVIGDPAVGKDGSLYLVHRTGVGGAFPTTQLSRLAQDGSVLWTTVDFSTLAPPALYAGSLIAFNVALSNDDLAVVGTLVTTATQDLTTLIAFDPAAGDPRWITTVQGEIVGGPAVRADGTIVVILLDPYASTYALASFDPRSGTQSIHPLASGAVEIFAITAGGVVIAGAEGGYGLTGLVALANDGTALWHNDGAENATIASDGTILASGIAGDGGPGPSIRAIDPATGTTKWELAAPSSGACMRDFALTSERGIVGLQCDGTVFGARD